MSEPSKVYLKRVSEAGDADEWGRAAAAALAALAPIVEIASNDLVAIKLHVGEPGLTTFLPPQVAAQAAKLARAQGARPFLTDTSVLYSGPRSNGVGHTETALAHGFTFDRVGAVFIPADGLEGNLETRIPINGRHFQEVGVAASIAGADSMIVISHATGHLAAGFGATIKNLGMGCSSRKGKLLQHSDTKPFIKEGRCEGCGACWSACPEDAIVTKADGTAWIDDAKCVGCGECIAHCRIDAVGFNWDSASSSLQEKMAEHALGVVRSLNSKVIFLLGLVNLTKDCDCLSRTSPKVAKDIGFAASRDPIALDHLALDLVRAAEGRRLDELSYPRLDGTLQLLFGEKLGLGSRQYELITL